MAVYHMHHVATTKNYEKFEADVGQGVIITSYLPLGTPQESFTVFMPDMPKVKKSIKKLKRVHA